MVVELYKSGNKVRLLPKKIKSTTELTVAGLVNKIRRLERLEDYPSFTVASISPDFSSVLVCVFDASFDTSLEGRFHIFASETVGFDHDNNRLNETSMNNISS